MPPPLRATSTSKGKQGQHLHHRLVRLAKDVLEILALDEADNDDALLKIESTSCSDVVSLATTNTDSTKDDGDDNNDKEDHQGGGRWDHMWQVWAPPLDEPDDKEINEKMMASSEEAVVAPTNTADRTNSTTTQGGGGGPQSLFRQRATTNTKSLSVDEEEEDEDNDDDDENEGEFNDARSRSWTDNMWEYILKDEEIFEDDNDDDEPPFEAEDTFGANDPALESSSSLSQSFRGHTFRFRFWECDDDDDDDDASNSDDDDDDEGSYEDDNDDDVVFQSNHKWDSYFDPNDSDSDSSSSSSFDDDGNVVDTESLSLEGTEERSISQDDIMINEANKSDTAESLSLERPEAGNSSSSQEDVNAKEIEEFIEGPTTLLKHCLMTKNDDTDMKDNVAIDDSINPPCKERKRQRQMSALRSRVFKNLASKPKHITFKEHDETVSSDEQQGAREPAKPTKMASLSSRLFTLNKLLKQADNTDPKPDPEEDVPFDEESDEQAAEQKWERLSSRLVIQASTNTDANELEREVGLIDSVDGVLLVQPAEPKRTSVSSPSQLSMILTKPEKADSSEHEQEVDLMNSEVYDVVEPSADTQVEPKWTSVFSFFQSTKPEETDGCEHEHEVSHIDSLDDMVPSADEQQAEPAEWTSFPSQFMNLPEPETKIVRLEPEFGLIDLVDDLVSSPDEQAEFWTSFPSQFTTFPKTENVAREQEIGLIDPEDDFDEKESEPLRPKRTIAFSRMLPFRRQEKGSPSLFEKNVPVEHADISKDGMFSPFANFVDSDLSPNKDGTESGSSTGSDWMSSSFGETTNNSNNEDTNDKGGEAEVPGSITLKNKSSFSPKLALTKSKLWSPRLSNAVVGIDCEDNIEKDDDKKIEHDENDHKMALLRQRWASMSKEKNDACQKNRKMSIGVEVRDVHGNVIRKIWLRSRRNKSTIEVTDSDTTSTDKTNAISQRYLSPLEAEKIFSWLNETNKQRRRRGWKLPKKEQVETDVIDCASILKICKKSSS